jgi:RNase P subunit RPR2
MILEERAMFTEFTETQKQKMSENISRATDEDRKYELKLPKGWKEIFPTMAFCKICRKPTISYRAIRSPGGRSYYHKKCVGKSPLFLKMGGMEM